MSAPLAWRLGSEGDSRKPLRRLVRPPEEPRPSGLTSAQGVGRAAGQVSCPAPSGPGNQLRSAPRWRWNPKRTQFLSGGPSRGPTRALCPCVHERRHAGLWRLFIVLGAGWRGSRTSSRAGPRVPGPPPDSSCCAGAPRGWGSRLARPAHGGRGSRVGGGFQDGWGLPGLRGAGPLWSRPARAHLGQDLRALVWGREWVLRKRPAPPPTSPEGPSPSPACDALLPPLVSARGAGLGASRTPTPQPGSGVPLPLQRWAAWRWCSPDLGSRTPWPGLRPSCGASCCILWAPSGNSSGARAEGRAP